MDRTGVGIGVVIGIVLSSIEAAYMLFLRVPSVLAVRPELEDVGFVTGCSVGEAGCTSGTIIRF